MRTYTRQTTEQTDMLTLFLWGYQVIDLSETNLYRSGYQWELEGVYGPVCSTEAGAWASAAEHVELVMTVKEVTRLH